MNPGHPRRSEVRREEILAADGTSLALYRVGEVGAQPVLLMPGTFSNHTFWLGTRGHGLAWALGDAGFEAIVLDPRGHGGSDRPEGAEWNLDHWGRLDVPAAIEAVTPAGGRALLVGHSAGGAAMLMALAGEPGIRDRVAGIVILATPVPWLQNWPRPVMWGFRALSRLLGGFPARLIRLGPEDELEGVMTQWTTWGLERRWESEDGLDYVRELASVQVPALALSGAGDTRFAPAPACRTLLEMVGSDDAAYRLVGMETGFTEDFDHPGIVVSRAAREEVWPEIIAWLRSRAPG